MALKKYEMDGGCGCEGAQPSRDVRRALNAGTAAATKAGPATGPQSAPRVFPVCGGN